MEWLFWFIINAVGVSALMTAVYRLISKPPEADAAAISRLVKEKRKEVSVFDRLNPQGSFLDKLDLFFARKMKLEPKLEEMHTLLGRPEKMDALKILHIKQLFAVILAGFVLYIFQTPAAFAFLIPGFILPDMYFKSKIAARQRVILGSFPMFVDLSALIIEAGLDYVTAFERIIHLSDKKNELEKEIEKMLSEIKFGYSRREALLRFVNSVGLAEIRSFVGLIVQSDELGTSLVDLLRNFSADLRFKRLNKAEQLAAKASTKMLIPLFFFIFPVVFILMLAPILANFLKGGFF